MIRRRRAVVAVVVAVVAVVVIGGGFAVSRLGTPSSTALGPPRFVDETAGSGVDHTYTGDFPYSVGGGVAVTDCDGDGRPDLYVAGGSAPAALYRNESTVGGALRFVEGGRSGDRSHRRASAPTRSTWMATGRST